MLLKWLAVTFVIIMVITIIGEVFDRWWYGKE